MGFSNAKFAVVYGIIFLLILILTHKVLKVSVVIQPLSLFENGIDIPSRIYKERIEGIREFILFSEIAKIKRGNILNESHLILTSGEDIFINPQFSTNISIDDIIEQWKKSNEQKSI